jgi:hypothetical protein
MVSQTYIIIIAMLLSGMVKELELYVKIQELHTTIVVEVERFPSLLTKFDLNHWHPSMTIHLQKDS